MPFFDNVLLLCYGRKRRKGKKEGREEERADKREGRREEEREKEKKIILFHVPITSLARDRKMLLY